MATAAWDHEDTYSDRGKLLKRATNPKESDKIATTNQFTSPILRIPGEIRNQVYTYACLSTTIKQGHRSDVSDGAYVFTQTFLLTCNQFYCEAWKLMYSLATFELSGQSRWISLKGLNTKYRRLITSVRLDYEVAWQASLLVNASMSMTQLMACGPRRCLSGVKRVYVQGAFQKNAIAMDGLRMICKNQDLQITGDEFTSNG